MSSSTRCAACKSLRRRCPKDCVLAPHFPSTNPERFASVHKVFGANNITKMLEQLPEQLRAEAADSLCFEACLRIQNPVYGCAGIIYQLQQQIMQTQNDIMKIKGEIAFHNAQRKQKQSQDQLQMIHAHNQGDQEPLSLVSSVQQNPNHSAPFPSTFGHFHI